MSLRGGAALRIARYGRAGLGWALRGKAGQRDTYQLKGFTQCQAPGNGRLAMRKHPRPVCASLVETWRGVT